MKKLLHSLLIATLAASATQAADYKPLLEEGKSWIMGYSTSLVFYGSVNCKVGMKESVVYHEYSVAGDAEAGGRQCKRVVAKNVGSDNVFREYLLNEENGVVSVYIDYYNEAAYMPLFDFNVSTGNPLHLEFETEPIYPSEVKTVIGRDGVERREIVFGANTYFAYDSWVEGIGSQGEGSWLLAPVKVGNGTETTYNMVECRKDGKTIFTNKDFAYPVSLGLESARTLTPGKSWTMARGDEQFTVTVDRDTLVGGVPCRMVKTSEGKEYVMAEDRGCLYVFLPQHGDPDPYRNALIISDLSKRVYRPDGATCRFLDESNMWRQLSANQLSIGGLEFDEYLFEDASGEVVASWVDGVGAPDSRSWAVVMPEDFQTLRMIDCRQDGEVIFSAEDFTYQSGIREVIADAARSSAAYDLQGRRVATPTRGLYILNGKKQLIR